MQEWAERSWAPAARGHTRYASLWLASPPAAASTRTCLPGLCSRIWPLALLPVPCCELCLVHRGTGIDACPRKYARFVPSLQRVLPPSDAPPQLSAAELVCAAVPSQNCTSLCAHHLPRCRGPEVDRLLVIDVMAVCSCLSVYPFCVCCWSGMHDG